MKRSFIIFYISILAVGCNKQIDEIRPLIKVDQDGELSSVAGITEATVGNYSMLRENGNASYDEPLLNISESRGNNVTLRVFGPIEKTTDAFFYRNNTGASLGFSNDLYRGSFQLIVSVNTALEGIEKFENNGWASLTEDEKNTILYAKGENIFLRAFTYFNMIRIYGKPYYQNSGNNPGVPIKKTSALNDLPAPSTVKEVYAFITSELKTAAQLMKAPVVKTNSFSSTAAAWALLSRAYLYMGGSIANPDPAFNEESATYADSVLNHTGNKYELLQGTDYNNLFADDQSGSIGRAKFAANKEIIFAFDNLTGNTRIGIMYNYDAIYDMGAIFLPSADLKSLFTAQDIRSHFFRTNPANGLVETTKYLVLLNQLLTRVPNIYFRTGEIYLNRAEAYAKQGKYALAKADLKAIHTRA
ncbi:MAG: RagB/SusD family nutrient uptake outer membrane protein, partial [Chitinophagaceae bacterium]|nr:RagB/SusD family nutrient uptake outer membrane protein [Chitinophagaceae bacterium]